MAFQFSEDKSRRRYELRIEKSDFAELKKTKRLETYAKDTTIVVTERVIGESRLGYEENKGKHVFGVNDWMLRDLTR